jgi:hypothetical protein
MAPRKRYRPLLCRGKLVSVLILTYHSLDGSDSPVSVTPETFRKHVERLRGAGYAVLPLREAMAHLDARTSASRVAALTFDDGYRTVLEHAAPALDRYGWRATVFAVTSHTGGTNQWPGQGMTVPSARLLSWSDLGDLAGIGWEIGAHTRTHPDLRALDDEVLADEVRGSKAELEDRLGHEVMSFAYPLGSFDGRVLRIVRSHFAFGCTTAMGIVRASSDRHQLERVETWYFGRFGLQGLLASPLMEPYIRLCQHARAMRARRGGREFFGGLASGEPRQRHA